MLSLFFIKPFKNITKVSDLAAGLGTTPAKLYDYLRLKGVMDFYNIPESGYKDWFIPVPQSNYKVQRFDLTAKGLAGIQALIKKDGLGKVVGMWPYGTYRKGARHGFKGKVPKRKR